MLFILLNVERITVTWIIDQKVPKEAERCGLQISIRVFSKIFCCTWTVGCQKFVYCNVMPRTVYFGWICISKQKYIWGSRNMSLDCDLWADESFSPKAVNKRFFIVFIFVEASYQEKLAQKGIKWKLKEYSYNSTNVYEYWICTVNPNKTHLA